jgi:hypothetical protein
MGQFPSKLYRSLSGVAVKRVFGNRSSGWNIEMTFRNTSEANAIAIWDHYIAQSGDIIRFTLPALIFSGSSATFSNKVLTLQSIAWEYSGPPEIDQPFNLLYDITVSLNGELVYG